MSVALLERAIEKRANLWEQAKAVIDAAEAEGRDLTAEESQKWDRLEADIQAETEKITRLENARRMAAQFSGAPAGVAAVGGDGATAPDVRSAEELYAEAWRNAMRFGAADLEPEQRRALVHGAMRPEELRALGVGTTTAGGYLVPPEFEQQLIRTMKAFGGMLGLAENITTQSGANMQWPTVDDTGNVGAILAENTQVAQQDVVFGTNSLDAYMYSSKLVLVSLQLIQDSAFDIDATLTSILGERLGRILNQHFTTGTGTAQPDGIITSATVGVTLPTGNTTSITSDGVIDLVHSVDPAYRNERSRFMMNDTTLKTVRKLKDTTNQYLWQPGLSAGAPDLLLGRPISINQDMASPAANAKTMLFGDIFTAYVIRQVRGIQTLRLTERYADFLQVGYLAFCRFDGTLRVPGAVRVLQQSAT